MKPRRKRKTKDHLEGRDKTSENIESSLLESYFQGTETVNRGTFPTSRVRDSCKNCLASFQNSCGPRTAVWFSFVFFPNGRIYCRYPVPMPSVYAKCAVIMLINVVQFSLVKKATLYSICLFLWCKYSNDDQF